jgi:hypothetical protein
LPRWRTERSAVGFDIISWDEPGEIVAFKGMARPLKPINLRRLMGEPLR